MPSAFEVSSKLAAIVQSSSLINLHDVHSTGSPPQCTQGHISVSRMDCLSFLRCLIADLVIGLNARYITKLSRGTQDGMSCWFRALQGLTSCSASWCTAQT